jgi:hypothetical protein
MVFPFQIDETIINGKRFFEMIEHYQVMIDNVKSKEMSEKHNIIVNFGIDVELQKNKEKLLKKEEEEKKNLILKTEENGVISIKKKGRKSKSKIIS